MPSCAAPNCTNSSKKGFRVFRFPKDKERRKIWIENCRREQWSPTSFSVICEGHFEETEFELHRQDGWKKLRPNAVPTIFDVANPPNKTFKHPPKLPHFITTLVETEKERLENEHSYITKTSSEESAGSASTASEATNSTDSKDENIAFSHKRCDLKAKRLKNLVRDLQRQNQKLKSEMNFMQNNLKSFLTQNQITRLTYKNETNGKGCVAPWDEETLVLAQRLFVSLGKRGYECLRDTGYPLPSKRTLIRHRNDKINIVHNEEKCVSDASDNTCSELDDLNGFETVQTNYQMPIL